MIGLALLFSIFNAVGGVILAYRLTLSYAGVIAFVTGVVSVLTFLLSPKKGALRGWVNRRRHQRNLRP